MTRKETAHDASEMRNIARAMQQELDLLASLSPDIGRLSTAGTIGRWDVATAMGTGVDGAHQQMIRCLTTFLRSYEGLVRAVDTAGANYELSEADARRRHEDVGRGLDPRPTQESQN